MSLSRSLSALICAASLIWNIPNRGFALPAREIDRPANAEDDLTIDLEEVPSVSEGTRTKYLVHFRNNSDHEVSYSDFQVNFPDLKDQAYVLSVHEAKSWEEAERLAKLPKGKPPTSSGGSTYVPSYSGPIHSTGGSCKTECVVLIIIFVVLVVGIVFLVMHQNNEEKKLKEAQNSQMKSFDELNQRPLQLLRFRSETRQMIIQNSSDLKLGTIEIKMKDSFGRTRTFRTQAGHMPST